MRCDRCGENQIELHQQVGNPPTFYCCSCNGCGPDCRAAGRKAAPAVDDPDPEWEPGYDRGGRLPVTPPLSLVAGNRRASR